MIARKVDHRSGLRQPCDPAAITLNPILRLVLCAVLAWQATLGALALLGGSWNGLQHGYGARLSATTGERIARTLGDDAPVYLALRELPHGAVVLSGVDARAAASPENLERVRLVKQLQHLLYPSPFLPDPRPAPVEAAEAMARPGFPIWLLVRSGDPDPAGRAGWTLMLREERFQLWRLQKD